MKTTKSKLTISQEDYETLNTYLKGLRPVINFDKKNAALLQGELKKATLVKKGELPTDVVGLNSRVVVKDGTKDKLIEMTLVIPEKADINQKKISVFAPIGTALLGFRRGEKIEWEVPGGNKTFTIMEVHNQKA
jgi:regulator of nucleoside diphosphate kinase